TRRGGRTRLLRLSHLAPTRRRTRQCRKGRRLARPRAQRRSGAASPPSRHRSAPPRQPLHREVSISKAILTPGSPTGTRVRPPRTAPGDEAVPDPCQTQEPEPRHAGKAVESVAGKTA